MKTWNNGETYIYCFFVHKTYKEVNYVKCKVLNDTQRTNIYTNVGIITI